MQKTNERVRCYWRNVQWSRVTAFAVLLLGVLLLGSIGGAQETVTNPASEASPVTVNDVVKVIEAFSSGNAAVGWRLLLSILVGTFMPLIAAFVMRTKWDIGTKQRAAYIISFVLAVIMTTFQEGFPVSFTAQGMGTYGLWLFAQFSVINALAKQSHDTFWRDLGIQRLEKATNY